MKLSIFCAMMLASPLATSAEFSLFKIEAIVVIPNNTEAYTLPEELFLDMCVKSANNNAIVDDFEIDIIKQIGDTEIIDIDIDKDDVLEKGANRNLRASSGNRNLAYGPHANWVYIAENMPSYYGSNSYWSDIQRRVRAVLEGIGSMWFYQNRYTYTSRYVVTGYCGRYCKQEDDDDDDRAGYSYVGADDDDEDHYGRKLRRTEEQDSAKTVGMNPVEEALCDCLKAGPFDKFSNAAACFLVAGPNEGENN